MEGLEAGIGRYTGKNISDTLFEVIDEVSKYLTAQIEYNRLKIGEKYSRYLIRRLSKINLFASNNRRVDVNSSYIKVCMDNEIESDKYTSIEEIKQRLLDYREKNSVPLDPIFPFEAMENCKEGLAIIGNPGSGKTSAMKYLAVHCALGKKLRGKKRIPFFIPTIKLQRQKLSVSQYCINHLEHLGFEQAEELFHLLLSRGYAFLLLDGLDESDKIFQVQYLNEMEDLIAKNDKSLYCISSRPRSLSVALSNFEKWEIKDLTFDLKIEFIKSWYKDYNEDKGKKLITNVNGNPALVELGSNPLLLSIVCALFDNDLQIPDNIEELYSRCLDGIMGQWDSFRSISRKGALASFSLRERTFIVGYMATYLFQNGKIVFSIDDLEDLHSKGTIQEKVRKEIPHFSELFSTLCNDFGILVKRSPNLYTFSHLSIQEFLTANYIVKTRSDVLNADHLVKKEEYSNVLRFVVRLLTNSDDFIIRAMHYLKNKDSVSISSLITILNSSPLCSTEILKKMYLQLSELIKKAIKKTPKELQIKFEPEQSTIYVFLDGRIKDKSFKEIFSIIAFNRSYNLFMFYENDQRIRQDLLTDKKQLKGDKANRRLLKKVQDELDQNKAKMKFWNSLFLVLSQLDLLIKALKQSPFEANELNIEDNNFLKQVYNHKEEIKDISYIISYENSVQQAVITS